MRTHATKEMTLRSVLTRWRSVLRRWRRSLSDRPEHSPLQPGPVFVTMVLRATHALGAAGGAVAAGLALTERNRPCRSLFALSGFAPKTDSGGPSRPGGTASLVGSGSVLQAGQEEEWLLDCLADLPPIDTSIYSVVVLEAESEQGLPL